MVKEQGYAGFTILVEIYFKGVNDGDTEKMVRKLLFLETANMYYGTGVNFTHSHWPKSEMLL